MRLAYITHLFYLGKKVSKGDSLHVTTAGIGLEDAFSAETKWYFMCLPQIERLESGKHIKYVIK